MFRGKILLAEKILPSESIENSQEFSGLRMSWLK